MDSGEIKEKLFVKMRLLIGTEYLTDGLIQWSQVLLLIWVMAHGR